jgi:hypothetical protein
MELNILTGTSEETLMNCDFITERFSRLCYTYDEGGNGMG